MANTAYIPPAQPPPKKWYQTRRGRIILIMLGLILGAGVVFGLQVQRAYRQIRAQALQSVDPGAAVSRLKTPGPYANMNVKGRPWTGTNTPKLTIVEFIDFNCPVCRQSYPLIREITRTYADDVKLVIRHFPVIDESSRVLALASECAHEQNLFWNMHDRFYQSDRPAEIIAATARQSGLDMSQFNVCLQEQKYMEKVNQDYEAAQAIGARGTPTWIVNGHVLSGGIPREAFIQIIETLLQT